MSEQQYDTSPEAVQQSYPEVVQHQPQYGHAAPYGASPKPQAQSPYQQTPVAQSMYGGSTVHPASPYNQSAVVAGPPVEEKRKSDKGTVCGCTLLVFVLCVIIALLAAAVIGLAAGTGIEANRANDATDRLAQLSSSIATAGPTATSTGSPAAATKTFNDLDKGCSNNPDGTTGNTYQSQQCKSNPPHPPWPLTVGEKSQGFSP